MRVAILYTGYSNANSVRPMEVMRYLAARGHEVVMVDLLDFAQTRLLRWREPVVGMMMRYGLVGGGGLVGPMKQWADIIQRKVLDRDTFDAVICMSFPHAYFLTKDHPFVKIYDCPTPAVDELEFSGEYSEAVIKDLREIEMEIYRSSDYVVFHWKTYEDYVRKHWYNGTNLLTLSYGCHPKDVRTRFTSPPRAVYMGYLGGYWSNMELLSGLTRQGICDIDVYGIPKPNVRYGLNYRGFSENTDVLIEYQLGLVTCSKDPLRRQGFSAKHIEYISYGLPVLVPEWRECLDLISGSVPYTEDNFRDVVTALSDEDEWTRVSELAYKQARMLDWELTLAGLERMVGGG